MRWTRLLRAELRKLTTTRMPLGFLAALVVIAAINGIAIVFGTDMDGSKAFIATVADQRERLAFGTNTMLGAGLFGAIAVAREYGHNTVVPTFLAAPRRHVTLLAQFSAVTMGGAVLSIVGQLFVVAEGPTLVAAVAALLAWAAIPAAIGLTAVQRRDVV